MRTSMPPFLLPICFNYTSTSVTLFPHITYVHYHNISSFIRAVHKYGSRVSITIKLFYTEKKCLYTFVIFRRSDNIKRSDKMYSIRNITKILLDVYLHL